MAVYNTSNEAYDNGEGLTETSLIVLKDGTVVTTDNRFPVDITGQEITITPTISLPAGYGKIHKFGAVPSMSQDTNGTIWDENDTVYPWTTVDANTVLTVNVVAPNNEGSARTTHDGDTVEIQGLDGNYDLQTETVTISGSSATTINTFKRVFRAQFTNGGSFDPNSERILIKSGGTTVAKILEDIGQTMMSIYTIPAGKTGYLMRLDITAQGTATGSFKLYCRDNGVGSFRVKHTAEVNGVGGAYQLIYPLPQPLLEKTDIDARMITQSNNGRYTCTFDIMLVDNP
jgi:hypothetical protein